MYRRPSCDTLSICKGVQPLSKGQTLSSSRRGRQWTGTPSFMPVGLLAFFPQNSFCHWRYLAEDKAKARGDSRTSRGLDAASSRTCEVLRQPRSQQLTLEQTVTRGGRLGYQPNRPSGAKSQQIVATRPLYCLQYPLVHSVVCRGFTPTREEIVMLGTGVGHVDLTREPKGML
jgi:hypothetical protein